MLMDVYGDIGVEHLGKGSVGRALIDTVEAIYSGLESEAPGKWLERVLPHLSSCVGWDQGAYAHAYDLRGPASRWKLSLPVTHDLPRELATTIVRCFELATADLNRRLLLSSGPAGTFSAFSGATFDQMLGGAEMSAATGIRDCAFVNAANPDGDGILLSITSKKPQSIAANLRNRLAMVAAHVAAAQRLLRALVRGNATPAAIFETDGRVAHVEHAHEGALPLLRERLLAVDRARGRLRRTDPDKALASWEALLRGQYSTIDRFESDNRRYVVAFANVPNLIDPRGLTEAEATVAAWAARGHAEKLIAYELGVAQGTVSALLSRAYGKLGVRSRPELVARFEAPTDVERVKVDDTEVLLFSAPSRREDVLGALSPAERDVACAAARGCDNRTIAAERGVSVATVAKQLASAYRKLGVGTRVELALLLKPDGGARPTHSEH